MLFLHVAPSSAYKSSCIMIVSGGEQRGSQPLDWTLSSLRLLASEIKQTFLSPGLLLYYLLSSKQPDLTFDNNMEDGRASQMVLVVKNSSASAGEVREAGSILESERSRGEGNGNPFQCSSLENPMDRGAWRAMVNRVTQGQTRLK